MGVMFAPILAFFVLAIIALFVDLAIGFNSMYSADTSQSKSSTSTNGSSVKYVQWALDIANDASHGYTMGALGPNEFDCQGFVKAALKEAGYETVFETWGFASDGTGTSAAPEGLKALGFNQHDYNADELQPGDILLKTAYGSGHVAIYVGDGHSVDAVHDLDGKPGDGRNGQGVNNEEIGLFDLSFTAWQYYFRAS